LWELGATHNLHWESGFSVTKIMVLKLEVSIVASENIDDDASSLALLFKS